ncbi:MAG: alcohol dehydrogenase [Bacteroidetes bacterium]|nr:MAG: alcohol dehydrogenase [Bacteroidota bacterium]
MKAMILHGLTDLKSNAAPLTPGILPDPIPGPNELLIRVSTCGVCHTELDEIEGRTPPSHFPMVLGHQVVGRIEAMGSGTTKHQTGTRVGVAWIHSACGTCQYCREGNENLCPGFKATGRDVYGGYAEYMTVPENYAFPIPDVFTDEEASPLLCAGAIGYRSIRLSGIRHPASAIGLTGFGASAHLVLKMIRHRWPEVKVFVFARNERERVFARELGAVWAGDTTDIPPEKMDAIIDTTPVWKPVVEALKNLKPGGRMVINAIRKEDADKEYLLKLNYPEHLWMEKEIKSVANVTGSDVREFLTLAAEMPIKPEVQLYPLEDANKALLELKQQQIRGAKVLKVK